jgi:hypothetical protein
VSSAEEDYRRRLEQEGPGGPNGPAFRVGGHRAGKQSVAFGDFLIQFNPLTGELMVTSQTEVVVVEGLRPGVARLMSHRHDPNVGVKI